MENHRNLMQRQQLTDTPSLRGLLRPRQSSFGRVFAGKKRDGLFPRNAGMRGICITLVLLLSACAGDKTILTKASYNDLPNWNADSHIEPLELFKASCARNEKRPQAWQTKASVTITDAEPWKQVCERAETLPLSNDKTNNDGLAREFFEQNFIPYHVRSEEYSKGLITGYYEPVIKGSRKQGGKFTTPVYGMPYDRSNAKPTRAQIQAGALEGKAPVLLYVDDPIMLFFLHIQGSGKVELENGELVGLQYAGQNGHPYVAIGKILKDAEVLETVSMQTIREWLAHSCHATYAMNLNPSYVYFKLADGNAYAKGALGIPLTPLRSIAVDDERATYGMPTYIATQRHDYATKQKQPLTRLFVAQDTGGALRGPHRADLFFGRGEAEEWSAGLQNARGDVYWLLPKALEPTLAEISND